MAQDPDCIFCKIVAGKIPCFKVHEDGETLAFLDINPVHDGHCLVIPKAHYPTVFETPPDVVAAVARSTVKVANAVKRAVALDGLNLLQANGPGAAQSVMHFHIHILPRRRDDELKMNWTPKSGDGAHIAKIADRIRSAL
jgi:histidine triad (HIT) family protein